MGGNFVIPCNIGGLKHMDALVSQGFNVNVMPLSIYNRLTNERAAEIDIRLSLASHSYIYSLRIARDVLVEFDKGTITLRYGKNKISFHKRPEPVRELEKKTKNNIEPIAPTTTENRLDLEWEERIKLHQKKEMEFDQWRSKIFNKIRPTPMREEFEVRNKGGVT
ncbi:hypothetical protein Tco_1567849 [Tanacetum coccineum]